MLRHVACEGQTIGQLAKGYGCAVEELVRVNGLTRDAPLVGGMVIWVPVAEPVGMSEGMADQLSGLGLATEAAALPLAPPVLRLPVTIFAALRRHAQRSGTHRILLNLRPAGEGDVTHLHFPDNSQS